MPKTSVNFWEWEVYSDPEGRIWVSSDTHAMEICINSSNPRLDEIVHTIKNSQKEPF